MSRRALRRSSQWIPAVSMLLVSLISYVDRSTLAILAPTILRETHLTGEQYGFIISGFSIAYMVSNPFWGWILDRAGLRLGMFAAVSWWTLASVAHAFAGGFWSFGAARTALGLGEGATFPGGLRAVVQTLGPDQRGRGLAVAYSGGSLGALVTPLIVTPIYLWWGWRSAFWFTGIIGAAWLLFWTFISRRPDIAHHQSVTVRPTDPALRPRFTDPAIWAFMSAYALGALPLGFVLYSASLYLAKPLGNSQDFIGKVLWIPPLGWEVGYFVWGWLSDRSHRLNQPRIPALGRMIAICAVLNCVFLAVPWMSNVWAVLAAMFLAMFVSSGFVVLSVAYATHVYSSDYAGLIAGTGAGSWSFLVALAMPYFGRLFDQQRYPVAFWIATVVPLFGYAGWRWLDSIRRSGTEPHMTFVSRQNG
jgi:ACS family hexuronate transporter-like MFS transporter